MRTIVHNYATSTISVREETLNGRKYLVAPITMIVNGVLPGSHGALFYPSREIKASQNLWNNVPITLDHPHPINGMTRSAKDPQVAQRQGLGFIANSRIKEQDYQKPLRLIADGWFDVQLCKQKAPELLMMLNTHQPISVSTGLFTQKQPAPFGATFNGREYSYIATGYRPDHLAILLEKPAACSIQDGCGVLIANRKHTNSSPRKSSGGCSCGNTCDKCKLKPLRSAVENALLLTTNGGPGSGPRPGQGRGIPKKKKWFNRIDTPVGIGVGAGAVGLAALYPKQAKSLASDISKIVPGAKTVVSGIASVGKKYSPVVKKRLTAIKKAVAERIAAIRQGVSQRFRSAKEAIFGASKSASTQLEKAVKEAAKSSKTRKTTTRKSNTTEPTLKSRKVSQAKGKPRKRSSSSARKRSDK